MKVTQTIRIALQALKRNRSRSALTILGIVIGITAIILVVSVGEGAQGLILEQFEGFGTRSIFVEPGKEPSGPRDQSQIFSTSLKERELEALRRPGNVPDVEQAEPLVIVPALATYRGESKGLTVTGLSTLQREILGFETSQGRFIDETDTDSYARVAVLGKKTKEALFGESDAVGQNVKIKNQTFRVVGVLAPASAASLFIDADNGIAVPYTSAQRYLSGQNHYQAIIVQVSTEDAVPRAKLDIERTLRDLHNIDDPEKDDFHVSSQEDAAEAVGTVTTILQALLGSVAAVSLIVGGIGIMNIMLVSVTERTREIGLRKSLGARKRDISRQFLVEAITLTAIGGIVGIALGALLTFVVSIIISNVLGVNWPFIFSFQAAIIGFIVSALIGLAFGYYPARQAAKKSPMEALRYE